HVPVIFMTGLTDTAHIVMGFEAGGVDYVAKPIVPDELIARIRTHLTVVTGPRPVHAKNCNNPTFITASNAVMAIILHSAAGKYMHYIVVVRRE
ncbi:MAG: hypothetical protein Dbin4_01635, partial [Alphaproteobacteria bacterium]|nr:hypothetical protein [Alphaproteobacteria bacterium]